MQSVPNHPSPAARSRSADGFTLIELVVVVVIIGIIAAIAIPKMSRFRRAAMDAQVRAGGVELQRAIERYAAEHAGRSPAHEIGGTINTDWEQFAGRLTGRTDESGDVNPMHPLGPYLASFPTNPYTACTWARIDGTSTPQDCAWWFSPALNNVRPDHSDVLADGDHTFHMD